jgi:hypothetical protein
MFEFLILISNIFIIFMKVKPDFSIGYIYPLTCVIISYQKGKDFIFKKVSN